MSPPNDQPRQFDTPRYSWRMRGEVYWIPAEALRPGVPGVAHPHVVVSDDVFNHSRIPSIVVCGLSSRLSRASEPGTVLLDKGEGGLPQRSVVVASQVSVVDKADLGEPIGTLHARRVDQIVATLRSVQRRTTRTERA